MNEVVLHPYTQAVLDAWKRLAGDAGDGAEPVSEEFPGLVSHLFVLHRAGHADFPFRRVGNCIERLFGRALLEHDFLSLWTPLDRSLVGAVMLSAIGDRGPALVRARGESLHGRRIELEFALAPISTSGAAPDRFLGVCQALTPEDILAGRPVRRLQARGVFPPAPEPKHALLRIVS